MENRKFEEKLSSAFEEIVPADGFERIKQDLPQSRGERTSFVMTKRFTVKKAISIAVAACIVLAIGAFGFSYYGNNMSVATVIDIDVNPGIEIKANKNDKVLSAEALNDDGLAVLDGMELKDTHIDLAVNAVIGSMYKQGYLSDAGEGSILVTVQNKDAAKAEKIRRSVVRDIDETLKEKGAEVSVINQVATDFGEAKAFAEKQDISYGKAFFILNLVKKDGSLSAEELAPLSIREIAAVISDKNIDIKDIVDYDADDGIWENIAEEIEDTNEDIYENDLPQANDGELIGKEKAKQKALSHAGVAASDAVFKKIELDTDDGIRRYEVEFKAGSFEYEYEIDAKTGAVIKSEKEADDDANGKPSDGGNKPASGNISSAQTSSSAYISAARAKEIALEHAGVSKEKASFIKAEFDRDDGRYVYEIEFFSNGYDYEYEIDAESGKIIDFDKEYDD